MDSSYEDIYDTSQFRFKGTFDEQVEEVLQCIRLTRQEVEHLQILMDDLHESFNKYWSVVEIRLFGSIVTGLAIKSSDVDCYVQLHESSSYSTDKPLVVQARNILRQRNWIFKKLFALPSSKVPIVTCYHAPTNRLCDINFSSNMGVQNSKLISYLLHQDERALKLAILVKYWSKINNLTGTNLMPTYCLTMLVIFYLQQKHILPSVMELQTNTPAVYVDNWNTAYEDKGFVNFCNESLCQLLGGFFKYYHEFKFDKFIVSPFLATSVTRDLFSKMETVPENYFLYKKIVNEEIKPIRLDSLICVQDPFEHNRNCAVAVHNKLAIRMLSAFSNAASVYDNSNELIFLQQLLQTAGDKSVVQKPSKQRAVKPMINGGVRKQFKPTRNFKISFKNKKNVFKNNTQFTFR